MRRYIKWLLWLAMRVVWFGNTALMTIVVLSCVILTGGRWSVISPRSITTCSFSCSWFPYLRFYLMIIRLLPSLNPQPELKNFLADPTLAYNSLSLTIIPHISNEWLDWVYRSLLSIILSYFPIKSLFGWVKNKWLITIPSPYVGYRVPLS